MKTLMALGKQGVFEAAFATHANRTTDEFDDVARAWLKSTKHPKLGRPFTQCVYQPQLELLELPARERIQDVHRLGRRHRFHARRSPRRSTASRPSR